MLLLADENFPRPTVSALRADGHDVFWTRADAQGAKDPALLECTFSISPNKKPPKPEGWEALSILISAPYGHGSVDPASRDRRERGIETY